jgi:hypothetical protein
MNVQLTSQIRELTAAELDAVSGGLTTGFEQPSYSFGIALGVMIGCLGTAIVGILDYLFD